MQGQEGPPGPPGVGELPPDPFEGAILGWKDNTLAWLGAPVPLPAGTYGPILEYSDGLLTLESAVDLPYLTEIFLSDESGAQFFYRPVSSLIIDVSASDNVLTLSNNLNLDKFRVGDDVQEDPYWNQHEEWSSGPVVGAIVGPWSDAFDGDLVTGVFTYASNTSTLTLPSPASWTRKFEVYALKYGGTLFINGVDVGASIPGFDDTPKWHDITEIVGASGKLSSIGVSDAGTYYVQLSAVRLDGKLLVDASIPDPNAVLITAIDVDAPSITTDGGTWVAGQRVVGPEKSGEGTVQVSNANAVVLREDNQEWLIGQYITAPAQNLAARYVYTDEIRKKLL